MFELFSPITVPNMDCVKEDAQRIFREFPSRDANLWSKFWEKNCFEVRTLLTLSHYFLSPL